MASEICLGDLRILRPLLNVESDQLRQYLHRHNQTWREDSSNASPEYLRNLLRPVIWRDRKFRHALMQAKTPDEAYEIIVAQENAL